MFEVGALTLFDGYVAVDWSANNTPKSGKHSIWIAGRGWCAMEQPENPATRVEAMARIAALQRLRHRVNAQVWPFETLGEGEAHVLVEIFPSLVEPAPGPAVTDARQVSTMAARMEQLDRHGALAAHLSAPTSMPAMVCREEGTILGMQDSTELQEAAR